jgi:outer membrane immunogenic protein
VAADMPPAPPRAPAPVFKAPPKPMFNWTGFYLGINGGYSFGSADTTVTGLTPTATPVTISVRPNGWLGGAQAGYNWQAAGSDFVFGLETDFQATSESDTGTCTTPVCIPDAHAHIAYPYFGTGRVRLGWDPSQWLFYVTGGFAYVETDRSVNQLGVLSYHDLVWRPGWVVGGGIEYAFDMHWSIKAEYLYLDYGTSAVTVLNTGPLGPAPLGTVTLSTRWTDNVARGGINYRF